MTVVARRVKTLVMGHTRTVLAAETEIELAVDAHLFLEDVTIIGAEMWTEMIGGAAGWDSGDFTSMWELSRAGRMQEPGALLNAAHHVGCWEATVGINATQTIIGDTVRAWDIHFPTGYGVDIDEGGYIYLHNSFNNHMANPHNIGAVVVVYYVER